MAQPKSHSVSSAPTISVVIPTYNRAHLIGECLGSVIAQSVAPHEIIVVDDGSTDNTAEVLEEYGDRVTYVKQTNAGPGAARNNGIERASGDYIAFLDSDDFWTPWTLEVICEVVDAPVPPTIVLPKREEFDDKSSPFSAPPESEVRESLDIRRHASFNSFTSQKAVFSSSALVVRRQSLVDVGGFATNIMAAEDVDLGLRLGEHPGLTLILAPAMVHVRRTPASLTRSATYAFDGMQHLLAQERGNCYPGGRASQWQRRSFITFMCRGKSIQMLLAKRRAAAWRLYFDTFWWNLRLGKLAYVVAFPAIITFGLVGLVARNNDTVT